jgi:hypothetical protein
MRDNRQELIGSAIRHARRARKTTGRIVVSALGFGLAYYLDAENGADRRRQLRGLLRRSATAVDSMFAPEVGDPPAVFHPLLRGLGAEEPAPGHSRQYRAS